MYESGIYRALIALLGCRGTKCSGPVEVEEAHLDYHVGIRMGLTALLEGLTEHCTRCGGGHSRANCALHKAEKALNKEAK